jgi:hypothetical protein
MHKSEGVNQSVQFARIVVRLKKNSKALHLRKVENSNGSILTFSFKEEQEELVCYKRGGETQSNEASFDVARISFRLPSA